MKWMEASKAIGKIYSLEETPQHLDSNNFVFEDSEGKWVARFETGGDLGGPISNTKNSIRQQVEIFRILDEESGLSVPSVRGAHTDIENPFVAVEFFDGKKLNRFAAGEDRENPPEKDAMLELFETVGENIAEAHQVKYPEFGEIQGREEIDPDLSNAYEWLDKAVEVQTGFASESSAIDPSELEDIEAYLRGYMRENESELREYDESVHVVSDVHPANIMVSGDGESINFIDPEYGRAGLPAEDIYRARSELAGIHEEVLPEDADTVGREEGWNALVQGYESVADYDDLNRSLEESGFLFSLSLMSLVEYYERKDVDEKDEDYKAHVEKRQEGLMECLRDTVEDRSPDYETYREIWNS